MFYNDTIFFEIASQKENSLDNVWFNIEIY
jgi:hypothetical protein